MAVKPKVTFTFHETRLFLFHMEFLVAYFSDVANLWRFQKCSTGKKMNPVGSQQIPQFIHSRSFRDSDSRISWQNIYTHKPLKNITSPTAWKNLQPNESYNNTTAVAYLVEALCYKPECRGFESRWSGFFNWPNSSSRTLTLGSTQPLSEMSSRNLPGG
jgi:hypothetical protein